MNNDKLFQVEKEVEKYKIEQEINRISWGLDVHELFVKLIHDSDYRLKFKDVLTPKAERIKYKDWTECNCCGGSVGQSGKYCKHCGAKFVEVEDEK